eukprot:90888-Heterocapsa_arctica.AAC.1
MRGVQPRDVCGVDGCGSVFHHMCQTEWEMYQYHLESPDGDPKDCIYDSDGKKRCIHHHPYGKLALLPLISSTKEGSPNKSLSTTPALSEGSKPHTNEGNADKFLSTIPVFPEGSISHPITVVLEHVKEPPTNEGTSDKFFSTNQGLTMETHKEATTSALQTGTESNTIQLSFASQESLPNTKESYLQAIKEMYPETNVHRLANYLPYFENWATHRADAASKAFDA